MLNSEFETTLCRHLAEKPQHAYLFFSILIEATINKMKTRSSKGLKVKMLREDLPVTTNLKPKQIRIESATNELDINIWIKQEGVFVIAV